MNGPLPLHEWRFHDGEGGFSRGHPLVELREHSRPRLFMLIPRFLVQKARLGDLKMFHSFP